MIGKKEKKMEKLNIVVHKTQKEAIQASLAERERVFIEPSHYLSNFSVLKFHRYLIMPVPKKLYNIADKKLVKNINVFDFNLNSKFEEPIQQTPFNILVRNVYKQAGHNIQVNLENLPETKRVHTTQEGFVLIAWFLREKDIEINSIQIFSPYETTKELIERGVKDYIHNNVYKAFYPLSLERALKLYGILYLSKERKDPNKTYFVADLQEQLLGIRALKDFNPLLLEAALDYFEKESEYFKNILQFPPNNLVNKILEEFKHLEFLRRLEEQEHTEKSNAFTFNYFVPKKEMKRFFEKQLEKYIFFGDSVCPIVSPF